MLTILPIDQIDYAPWNYKSEDAAMQNHLTANLQRIGQVELVQVREKADGRYEMTNGNHRLTSVRHLQRKHIVAFNHGKISVEQAQRLTIETHISFQANRHKLAQLVADLARNSDLDDLLLSMPYNREDIDRMIHMARLTTVDEPPPETEEDDQPKTVTLAFQLTEEQAVAWAGHREKFESEFVAFLALLP